MVSKSSVDDALSWAQHAFPSYLQNQQEKQFPCQEGGGNAGNSFDGEKGKWKREISIWTDIRSEAEQDAASEPLLSSFLYASILAHDSFEQALAFVLSNRLANTTMLPTQLFEIFHEVLKRDDDVRCGALADLEACKDRDPACMSLSHALLYFKGYHAIQAHRIAHALWKRQQRVMALALQSRISEVFAVDIHPAARLGKGILLDHGTGVVIGETAVIGDNCSLLQNVTLGGTGKEVGDRHPKLDNNVLVGASATILGNIKIGEGSQIAAGSLVLKAVPPHTMVAGSPAKSVGTVTGNPAQKMLQWDEKRVKVSDNGGMSVTESVLDKLDSPVPRNNNPATPELKPASAAPPNAVVPAAQPNLNGKATAATPAAPPAPATTPADRKASPAAGRKARDDAEYII
eukprot:CAMPEP_0202902354 /NCGR_PEP_ID=MMETSP1392-20130828/16805_1 /ASSEMBLY_ACC=CAM_ASM_000868 /TAXON_ID=225041 /ORGANISM="Chlamydomonas chlamydogama, Strain SAG 11-48b" /LENGTH=402 /DNA_ID=CAMNT_0049589103 /DNA_START=281 /DNA_END=1489 /DNA_ORIENTATION=+